jgi:hypothetical protein
MAYTNSTLLGVILRRTEGDATDRRGFRGFDVLMSTSVELDKRFN